MAVVEDPKVMQRLVGRNPIMPERFCDENDENMHIQHVRINKPEFDVRESGGITMKTFNTVEDARMETPATPAYSKKGSNILQSKNGGKSQMKETSARNVREPTSPTESKKAS